MYNDDSILGQVFIVILVLVVIGLGAWQCTTNRSGENGKVAKETARKYARELGIEVKAMTCAKMDTDGDGYVSCTIMPTEGPPMMVECTGGWTLNEGCRAPKSSVHVYGE